MGFEIDRDRIAAPEPTLTKPAVDQLRLMLENDWTLEGKAIRISVSGKGCGGFDYALGFDEKHDQDFEVKTEGLTFVFDPFCAFYAQKLHIDFQFDPAQNDDGFVLTHPEQKDFMGKFWRQSEDKILPVKEDT